ncbi:hypothetical protein FBZ89_1471 [Nitrospirillum amazonense]|uniref:Integrase-like protein n=1 Tax=Nitrospirillum amazonense TaxID=28077 RepID=A0A560EI59_9PROT|nr:hypothetical protein FBZ89_1471 [Nitrospirillum amazonense]
MRSNILTCQQNLTGRIPAPIGHIPPAEAEAHFHATLDETALAA